MTLETAIETDDRARQTFISLIEANRENLFKLFLKGGYFFNTFDKSYGKDKGKLFFNFDDDITSFTERTAGKRDFQFDIFFKFSGESKAIQRRLDEIHGADFWKAAAIVLKTINEAIEKLHALSLSKEKLIRDMAEVLSVSNLKGISVIGSRIDIEKPRKRSKQFCNL